VPQFHAEGQKPEKKADTSRGGSKIEGLEPEAKPHPPLETPLPWEAGRVPTGISRFSSPGRRETQGNRPRKETLWGTVYQVGGLAQETSVDQSRADMNGRGMAQERTVF